MEPWSIYIVYGMELFFLEKDNIGGRENLHSNDLK